MFKKGDWVVNETSDGSLGQIVEDPYELSIYVEDRPMRSKTLMVADCSDSVGPQVPLHDLRHATNQDFLNEISGRKTDIQDRERQLDEFMEKYHDFVINTFNLKNY